jgi:hypothetical protein
MQNAECRTEEQRARFLDVPNHITNLRMPDGDEIGWTHKSPSAFVRTQFSM